MHLEVERKLDSFPSGEGFTGKDSCRSTFKGTGHDSSLVMKTH